VADFDLDTGKIANLAGFAWLLHEFVKLRLGVAPIPISLQIGRLACVPCDDLKPAGHRQHLTAPMPGAGIQGRELKIGDFEGRLDPRNHDDRAIVRLVWASAQSLVQPD